MEYSDTYIKCSVLCVPDYQRPTDMVRVRRMLKNFDEAQIRQITVSCRDGKYYVVDGLHTKELLQLKYGNDHMAFARIYKGLTYAEESSLFVKLNSNSKQVNFNDMLKASFESGEKEATKYINCLKSNGIDFTFSKGIGTGSLCCHKKVTSCIKCYGMENTINALKVLSGVHDRKRYSYWMIDGLSKVISTYKNINMDRLKSVISNIDINSVKTKGVAYGGNLASSGSTYGQYFSIPIVDEYNKYMRKNALDKSELWEVE